MGLSTINQDQKLLLREVEEKGFEISKNTLSIFEDLSNPDGLVYIVMCDAKGNRVPLFHQKMSKSMFWDVMHLCKNRSAWFREMVENSQQVSLFLKKNSQGYIEETFIKEKETLYINPLAEESLLFSPEFISGWSKDLKSWIFHLEESGRLNRLLDAGYSIWNTWQSIPVNKCVIYNAVKVKGKRYRCIVLLSKGFSDITSVSVYNEEGMVDILSEDFSLVIDKIDLLSEF